MKTKSLKQVLMMLLGSVILLSACKKEPDSVTPIFPEFGDIVLVAGETKTFDFNVNSNWTISLPLDQAGTWFYIQDDERKDYSKTGNKGAGEVVFAVADTEEFDNDRTCDIIMKMGGVEQVVGVLKRGTIDRDFSFSVDKYDVETETFPATPEYVEVDALETVKLYYPSNKSNYMTFVKVLANFNWVIKSSPEWLEPKGTDENLWIGHKNVAREFRFEAIVDKLPLEDATGTIVFAALDNEERTFEYQVSMPGVRDFVKVSGLNEETTFNAGGYFVNNDGIAQETMSNNILLKSAKDGVAIYVASTEGGQADWITVDLQNWNNTSGDILQSRTLKFTAELNAGDAGRSAVVLAYPTSLVSNPADMFNGTEVKEEYKKYIITTIVQEFLANFGDNLVSAFQTKEDLMAAGSIFVDEIPYYITGTLPTITSFAKAYPDAAPYRLVYKNHGASSVATLKVNMDDFTIAFMQSLTNGVPTDAAQSLYGVTVERDGSVITIKTDSVDPVTDYIVLYGANGIAFAVIEFIYDPEVNLARHDFSDPAYVTLVDPEAAATAGFTLAPAVPGLTNGEPGYGGYLMVSGQKFQAPMYELRQTVKYIDEENEISPKAKIAVSRPYASIEYRSITTGLAAIAIPNTGENSDAVWINYNRETGEVYMTQKIKDATKFNEFNNQYGAILFKDDEGVVFLVLCCHMRFDNPNWPANQ